MAREAGAFSDARVENVVFIPNEVLVTIFEKLPREDLERLQLVSAQFDAVIASSNELSAHQGPLRVVAKIEFGAYLYGSRFPQRSDMWLHDGTRVTCMDCENLAKRLKFAIVQELRWDASTRLDDSDIQRYAFIQSFSSLLPVKSAWENATIKASTDCFPSKAAFEFVFTQLLFCKEVILAEISSVSWSRAYMRLPGIAACDKRSINRLDPYGEGIQPFDVVEWLDHDVPPGKKREKKHMSICEGAIIGGISGLLAWLKTTFSASSSPKPYVVHILWCYRQDNLDEVLANEKTHERLSIRTEATGIFVERA